MIFKKINKSVVSTLLILESNLKLKKEFHEKKLTLTVVGWMATGPFRLLNLGDMVLYGSSWLLKLKDEGSNCESIFSDEKVFFICDLLLYISFCIFLYFFYHVLRWQGHENVFYNFEIPYLVTYMKTCTYADNKIAIHANENQLQDKEKPWTITQITQINKQTNKINIKIYVIMEIPNISYNGMTLRTVVPIFNIKFKLSFWIFNRGTSHFRSSEITTLQFDFIRFDTIGKPLLKFYLILICSSS